MSHREKKLLENNEKKIFLYKFLHFFVVFFSDAVLDLAADPENLVREDRNRAKDSRILLKCKLQIC